MANDTYSSRLQLSLSVPSEHSCYAAHFPGNPLVPGALLLKWIFAALERALDCQILAAKHIKFLAIVKPGEQLTIEVGPGAAAQQLALTVFARDAVVIKGSVIKSAAMAGAGERDHG